MILYTVFYIYFFITLKFPLTLEYKMLEVFLTIWKICAIVGFTFSSVCPIISIMFIRYHKSYKYIGPKCLVVLTMAGLALILLPVTLCIGFLVSISILIAELRG